MNNEGAGVIAIDDGGFSTTVVTEEQFRNVSFN